MPHAVVAAVAVTAALPGVVLPTAALGATVAAPAPVVSPPPAPVVPIALPASRPLPADVDDVPSYEPQTVCDPVARPGVVAFRALVLGALGGGDDGIVNTCAAEGMTSEHADGRAWDWARSAGNAAQKAMADGLLAWITAPGADGTPAVMARRFGIMYIIWNRRIWSSYRSAEGWRPYVGSSPHTDHVHFSFGWDGAMRRTSWWTGVPVHRRGCGSYAGDLLAPATRATPPALGALTSVPASSLLAATCRTGQQGAAVLRVLGVGQVPARGVAAVVLRVASLYPSAPIGGVRVGPSAGSAASAVLPGAGTSTVTVPVSGSGMVALAPETGTTALRVDLVGWVAASPAPVPAPAPPPAPVPGPVPAPSPTPVPVARRVAASRYVAVRPFVAFASARTPAGARFRVRVAGSRGVPLGVRRVRVKIQVNGPAGARPLAYPSGVLTLRPRPLDVSAICTVGRGGVVTVTNPMNRPVRATVTVLGWYR